MHKVRLLQNVIFIFLLALPILQTHHVQVNLVMFSSVHLEHLIQPANYSPPRIVLWPYGSCVLPGNART